MKSVRAAVQDTTVSNCYLLYNVIQYRPEVALCRQKIFFNVDNGAASHVFSIKKIDIGSVQPIKLSHCARVECNYVFI